jgi:hypothetical protein
MAKWNEKDPGGDKTEYLGNHTITCESGHMIEIDNTPGDRRVKIYHAKGTVLEIHDDGAMITTVKGKAQNFFNNSCEQKITGEFTLIIDGNVDLRVTGNMRHKIDGDYNLDCKNLYVKVAGLESREVIGEQRVQVNGKQTHRVSSDRETITGGNHVETTGGDSKNTTTGENVQITGGNGLIMTGGEQTVSAGGSVGIGGSAVGIASTGTTSLVAMGGLQLGFSDEVGGPVSETTVKGTSIQLNP